MFRAAHHEPIRSELAMTIGLTDQDILFRLTNTEDSTVERKAASDYRDVLKTAVAFSNSLPLDDPGIIFVGVYNDGRVQDNTGLESLEKKISDKLSNIYPPIYPQQKVLKDADGREFLAVIVRGSPRRPHFAGQAFIRDGCQSIAASESMFETLIAQRNNKTYELSRWKGKTVRLVECLREELVHGTTQRIPGSQADVKLHNCNQHYVTLEYADHAGKRALFSCPLNAFDLNYNNLRDQLELRLLDTRIKDW
jgi:predicted HTH transcriptional regulator